jgi:hypothetical protein
VLLHLLRILPHRRLRPLRLLLLACVGGQCMAPRSLARCGLALSCTV